MQRNTFFHKCIRHLKWLQSSIIGYISFKKIITKDTLVLVSHNGDSAGGAPVVLYELALVLKQRHHVVFLCEKPGKILDMCKENHIPAYTSYLMQKYYLKVAKANNVKAILVNTIASAKSIQILTKLNFCRPVFWWIHEESRLIIRHKPFVPQHLTPNFKILCVSHCVLNCMRENYPALKEHMQVFFYGCTDLFYDKERVWPQNDCSVVSVIGRICKRKNQSQIIEAYKMLPADVQKRIQVTFIYASFDPAYMHQLQEQVAGNRNIVFLGAVPRQKMVQVYAKSDLVVCCSLEDPLPVVVTEAMMCKCPLITSSETGQFALIKNGVNGFVYNVQSTEELSQKIMEVLSCPNKQILGDNERRTYLKYFTSEIMLRTFEDLLIS